MTDPKYTLRKVLLELVNGVPIYEYHLLNGFGVKVGCFSNERLAVKVKEALND